jgi:hypothetical protein
MYNLSNLTMAKTQLAWSPYMMDEDPLQSIPITDMWELTARCSQFPRVSDDYTVQSTAEDPHPIWQYGWDDPCPLPPDLQHKHGSFVTLYHSVMHSNLPIL